HAPRARPGAQHDPASGAISLGGQGDVVTPAKAPSEADTASAERRGQIKHQAERADFDRIGGPDGGGGTAPHAAADHRSPEALGDRPLTAPVDGSGAPPASLVSGAAASAHAPHFTSA